MNNKNKKSKTYEEFVEKFKPKKTTDDCYTPADVYEAIKEFALAEYKKEQKSKPKIIRPFYPGGDFENYDYPANAFVCDNPPFSIFSKILDFYIKNNIKFFLFYDTRMAISPLKKRADKNLSLVMCGVSITYENGAKVATCFYTNIYKKSKIILSYDLQKKIADCASQPKKAKRQKKRREPYFYSGTDLTSLLNNI